MCCQYSTRLIRSGSISFIADISLQSPRVRFGSFFFARFSTPFLVRLTSPPQLSCATLLSVCLALPCSLFLNCHREFPSTVKCRTLRLRSPALLWFQSSSVAPFFCEIFWAFLRAFHKSDRQVESSDRFLDIRPLGTGPHIRQFARRQVRQSAHQVVSQGHSECSVGGHSVRRVLRSGSHLASVASKATLCLP